MNKVQALHSFWKSFGISTYDEGSVPTEAPFPRLTYDVQVDNFNNPVAMSAALWYYSSSWTDIENKANEIEEAIGRSGRIVAFDYGAVWIYRGSPFRIRIYDTNDMIRHININISAEFID